MSQSWVLVLSGAIVSASLGFLFAILGLIFSQRYQRHLERQTLAAALLTEALDILDTLQLRQDLLDKLTSEATAPPIGLTTNDMPVYQSNAVKLGLLEGASAMYIIKFYSRVRRVIAGAPTRDLIGVGDKSALSTHEARKKEIADCITGGSCHRKLPGTNSAEEPSITGQWGEFGYLAVSRARQETNGLAVTCFSTPLAAILIGA